MYSLKLMLLQAQDLNKATQETLLKWLEEMQEFSSSFVVYIWVTELYKRAIVKPSKIIANIYQVKGFFSGLTHRLTRNTSFEKVEEEFSASTNWWYNGNGAELFSKTLQ